MLLLVVLLLLSCYTAISREAININNNKQQCCWLSMSIASNGGTAVKSAALVAAHLGWRCLLAVATVSFLGSLLCCLTLWYQVLYALV